MTKQQLITTIAADTEQSPFDVKAIIESYFKTTKQTIASGENIFIRGFGTFLAKTQKARTARNITAKSMVNVPEKIKPMFKASREFKEEVNLIKQK